MTSATGLRASDPSAHAVPSEQVRIVIEGVAPQIDSGRWAVKAVVGDLVQVGADIWKDGHELLKAAVLWRKVAPDERAAWEGPVRPPNIARHGWREARMVTDFGYNDRWFGTMDLDEVGAWTYTVVAWTDVFGSWLDEVSKKRAAGQKLASELLEGMAIVERTLATAKGDDRAALAARLEAMRAATRESRRADLAMDAALRELMDRADPRADAQAYSVELPLWVDRERARCGSWYEIFVRSQGTVPGRSATFREAERRLPEIAAMGFDVLYLAPIHPIGRANRKGPNNTEGRGPDAPGSPWAIGNEAGGHTAVDPDLGTLKDFDHFLKAAATRGMEIALDFAVQCSPDHPCVKEHPEWFAKRPDGTIKYAENPPKKYQDIYPINFETPNREGLYRELLETVLFWARRGVRIFRVDNPHTKPIGFWEWLIASVHREFPDALFLAEAFTRPKRMKALAKAGFSQSYTYFTWRNTRQELEEYGNELFNTDVRHFLRPNFFANTPDILHEALQKGGRPAFMTRLVLAATLSPTYGIYSGFELCENRAVREGSEEYLDSEKYQHKVWDWDRPGNIKPFVALVNKIRREHRALQLADNLRFLESTNPNVIAYTKTARDRSDDLVVVVNLDPLKVQEGTVRVPAEGFGRSEGEELKVRDLLTGDRYSWRGGWNYVQLDPKAIPAHVLHFER